MSGTIGNNILELEFPTAGETPGEDSGFDGSARERIKAMTSWTPSMILSLRITVMSGII